MMRWGRFILISLFLLTKGSQGEDGSESEDGTFEITMNMPQADSATLRHNDYRCTSVALPPTDSYIVRFEPRADPLVAHHMLLYGCEKSRSTAISWSCKSNYDICGSHGGSPQILFAWALNASGIQLPEGVGRKVGPSHGIQYAVLQIHYGEPEQATANPQSDPGNHEALILHMTQQRQPKVAGIFLLGSGSVISPQQKDAHVDVACRFSGPKSIYPFAFRTHAHSLSQVIAGYVVKGGDQWELIGSKSPQEPQAFYPVQNLVEVNTGDWLAARCVYNTMEKTHDMHMGPNSEDEMCNFYMMYYTANDRQSLVSDSCWSQAPASLVFPELPAFTVIEGTEHHHDHGMGVSDHQTEPEDKEGSNGEGGKSSLSEKLNSVGKDMNTDGTSSVGEGTEDKSEGDYVCPTPVPPGPPSVCVKPPVSSSPVPTPTPEPSNTPSNEPFFEGQDGLESETNPLVPAEDWPLNGVSSPTIGSVTLGQVTALSVDQEGYVHILHRGARVWDQDSFTAYNTYRHVDDGPITTPTLLKLSDNGELVRTWGEDMFYMPHGLTIDSLGNFWVTDVATHQVLKFPHEGAREPSLVLGKEFVPGSKYGYFCKPSSVAVEDSGDFYVADGYCNRRILKFDSTGAFLQEWSQPVDGLFLLVPHSLALSKSQDHLLVADRENGRIISYETSSGNSRVFSHLPGKVFAISLNGSGSWPLFAINNSLEATTSAHGYTVNQKGEVANVWGPEGGFSQPHDLAVDPTSGATYVGEISPNRIWKFVSVAVHTTVPVIPATPTDIPSTATEEVTTVTDVLDVMPDNSTDETTQSLPTESVITDDEQSSSPQTDTSSTADKEATVTMATETSVNNSATTIPPSDKVLPSDVPFSGPNVSDNISILIEEFEVIPTHHHGDSSSKTQQATQYGVFVAIFIVVIFIIVVMVGILKEHKYLRVFWWKVKSTKKPNTPRTQKRSKDPLHSILGPSQLGFSRLRTYDSDSEIEEFPIFSRV